MVRKLSSPPTPVELYSLLIAVNNHMVKWDILRFYVVIRMAYGNNTPGIIIDQGCLWPKLLLHFPTNFKTFNMLVRPRAGVVFTFF